MFWRSVAGIAGLGLVAVGAAGFCGWPAACLVMGAPVAFFYIADEWRRMRGGD